MDCRERVLRAIRFESPDRAPVSYSVSPRALLLYGQELVDLCREYPNDFCGADNIRVPTRDAANYQADGTYYRKHVDEWGCTWVYHQEGIAGEVKESPLADWGRLPEYRFPPVADTPERRAEMKAATDDQKAQGYIGWGSAGIFFERLQWVRGVEDLLADTAMRAPEVEVLADRLVEEHLLPNIELALAAGADVVGFGDDWGSQRALLVNPRYWRDVFKPRYQRCFDRVHEGGALTWMHSDGAILEIVPDLIEIGLDVVNPQARLIGCERLGAAGRGRICFAPDTDRQDLLPYGTPAAIRDHVREIRDTLMADRGGLIFAAGFYDDMPLANIEACLRAFHEFC